MLPDLHQRLRIYPSDIVNQNIDLTEKIHGLLNWFFELHYLQ